MDIEHSRVEENTESRPEAQGKHVPKLFSSWFIMAIGVLVLSLAIGMGYMLQTLLQMQSASEGGDTTDTTNYDPSLEVVMQGVRETFPEFNFTMEVFESWDHMRTKNIDVGQYEVVPHIGFKRTLTDCYMTYATIARPLGQQSAYASLITDQEGNTAQVGRYLPPELLPEGYDVRASTSPYTPRELAVMLYEPYAQNTALAESERYAWILYALSDEPLPAACIQEFTGMMRSLASSFESVPLAKRDEGVLSIMQHEHRGTHVLLKDEDTTRIIGTLDTGRIYKPTLADSILYYVGSNGLLYQYSLLDEDEAHQVSIDMPEDTQVNDFYRYDDILYVLAGPWCQTYKASCDLSLLTYDTQSEATETLREHITSRTILGYSEELDALYLSYREGDAGMMWGTISRYDAGSDTLEDRYTFTVDMADDATYEEYTTYMEELSEVIRTYETVNALALTAGSFEKGPAAIDGRLYEHVPIVYTTRTATDTE